MGIPEMASLSDLGAVLLAIGAIVGPVFAWFGNQWWSARKDRREQGAEERSERADERESMQTIIDGFERLRTVENEALRAVRKELQKAVDDGRLSRMACNRCLSHLDDVLEAWDALGAVIHKSADEIRASFHSRAERVREISMERHSQRTGEENQELAVKRAADAVLKGKDDEQA